MLAIQCDLLSRAFSPPILILQCELDISCKVAAIDFPLDMCPLTLTCVS